VPYVIVEAESGPIGGDSSHEFMVPCATGEDKIIQDVSTGYAANVERAEIGRIAWPAATDPAAPAAEKKATPHKRTIEEVAAFLGVKPQETAKLLVFSADEQIVAVLVRGDHEANEAKVRRAFGAKAIEMATPEQILKATGVPMGFLGPIGIKIPLVVDPSVAAMPRAVVGGNEVDVHYVNAVPGRDFALERVIDVRNAEAGDPSPKGTGEPMTICQGIEIGHVFKLGTKYSSAMNAVFLDEHGKQQPMIMGCYGIGVNRILAGAVEACHDANGIIWPMPIAPYDVVLVPLAVNNAEIMNLTDRFATALSNAGADVIVDDRDQRPGVKFKDCDLIGFPLRVVIGEKGVAAGTIELKWRDGGEAFTVPLADGPDAVIAVWNARREEHAAMCLSKKAGRESARNG
jgi:prolyl-tRNA synthetase